MVHLTVKVLLTIAMYNNSTFEASLEELGLFILKKKRKEKKRMLVAKWLSYEKGNRFLWPIFFFFDR